MRMSAIALAAAASVALAMAGRAAPGFGEGGAPPPPDSRAQAASAIDVDKHPGKALFNENCAMCHEGGTPKAPHREFLETMAPEAILEAMNHGVMQQQAAHLGQPERRHIAEYLTRTDLATHKPPPGPKMCEGAAKAFDLTQPPAQVGWGYDTRRFIPGDVAKLAAKDVGRLKLKWSIGFPSALRARSQPVVAMGAIFVGSQDGTVYALDMKTGCARWTSKVSAEVRTAVVVEPWKAGTKPAHNPRLFFGDLLGRVYAMDAITGKVLWRQRPDDHANATITGTPVPVGDTLYVPVSSLEVVTAADAKYACCTFRGSVAALDAATGEMKWQHYTVEKPAEQRGTTAVGTPSFGPSGAPVWGSPAYDAKRNLIYHGSGENYSSPADGNSDALFAVDATTGQRKWRFQLTAGDAWNSTCAMKAHPNCPMEKGPDFDLSASPMLIDVGNGKQLVVVGQKSGMVYGVDPDTGKPVWSQRAGRGSIQGGIHFGMAAEGATVFVGITDLTMSSDGGTITEAGFPGVHALDARTGKILWRSVAKDECAGKKYCDPGVSAAVTAIPDVVFAGYLDGKLRAHDSHSGKVLWQDDTTKPVTTVNGTTAHGGSISGPGVAVENGNVIVNSGYGFSYHMPGNVMLVYTIDGK